MLEYRGKDLADKEKTPEVVEIYYPTLGGFLIVVAIFLCVNVLWNLGNLFVLLLALTQDSGQTLALVVFDRREPAVSEVDRAAVEFFAEGGGVDEGEEDDFFDG